MNQALSRSTETFLNGDLILKFEQILQIVLQFQLLTSNM